MISGDFAAGSRRARLPGGDHPGGPNCLGRAVGPAFLGRSRPTATNGWTEACAP